VAFTDNFALSYHAWVKMPAVWQYRVVLTFALALSANAVAQPSANPPLASQQPPPPWAFAVDPPNAAGKPTGDKTRHVPGSKLTFTDSQIADLFGVPDWHPEAHPKMPEVVAQGRKPDVYACGYCHLPNGMGRPENASLAGLPKEYIIQQMAAFQSGARKSSEPRSLPVNAMIQVAAHADAKEVASATTYFAGLKPKPWIRVVETATVPKTHVVGWMLVTDEPVAHEPIGQRIVETPINLERTELRDDTSGFVAYVPPGSLKKGKLLVEKGGDGETMPCAMCHGPDLRGKDNVPSIAGRSPSYIVRQLYDLQIGSRGGAGTAMMQAPVMKLTLDDMVAIAAYLASLKP
jgi:cytochrome c553